MLGKSSRVSLSTRVERNGKSGVDAKSLLSFSMVSLDKHFLCTEIYIVSENVLFIMSRWLFLELAKMLF